MDKCVLKIINSATKELVKEIVCDNLDEANEWKYELVGRQNAGEKKLQGMSFAITVPNNYF